MSDEKDDKWEMPKPVFRSSTGTLPRSLEETISHSFMPNAETFEIDEDDDILSIMDTPSDYRAEKQAEYFDDEAITLTPDPTPETDVSEETSAAGAEQTQQVIGTSEKFAEEAETNPYGSQSNLFFFVIIALVAAVIIAAWLFYRP